LKIELRKGTELRRNFFQLVFPALLPLVTQTKFHIESVKKQLFKYGIDANDWSTNKLSIVTLRLITIVKQNKTIYLWTCFYHFERI
jgi:hypothetical protein